MTVPATSLRSSRSVRLLRPFLVALRDRRNRPDPRRVGDLVALGALRASRGDEQRLLVPPAERAADDPAWCGDDAEMLAVGSDRFDTSTGRHVEASLRDDRGAVAAARRELHELALIGQRPVPLHVE